MTTAIQLPRKHEWQELQSDHGVFVVEPFEPGFALTVGNAFRRVLLSSIEGAAPTWIKVDGVLHEFSFLPGATEDSLDILASLRKVVFKLHGERSRLIHLRTTGPDERDGQPDVPEPRRLEHAPQHDGEHDAGRHDEGRLQEEDPVEPRLVEDPLVREKVALDVSHGPSSPPASTGERLSA